MTLDAFEINALEIDLKIDAIYDEIDDLLHAGEFLQINTILCELDLDTLINDEIYSYLQMTVVVHDKIPDRPAFHARCVTELRKRGNAIENWLAFLESNQLQTRGK